MDNDDPSDSLSGDRLEKSIDRSQSDFNPLIVTPDF
jgi:hypothetical protein